MYCAFYDKANGKNYCDFLRKLRKEFGRVLLFLDNASCHKSGAGRYAWMRWAATSRYGTFCRIRRS